MDALSKISSQWQAAWQRSSVRLNKFAPQQAVRTPGELKVRELDLAIRMLGIWPASSAEGISPELVGYVEIVEQQA